jgi:hypothetical protein
VGELRRDVATLHPVHYAISLSPAGPAGDPRTMAELAVLAERAGWDAVFLEDYIVYPGDVGTPTFDPWVVMAAMAVATTRIRLGTLVTPVPRRRPWKLAMEAVTLDHLSGGRVILGAGAGDAAEASFTGTGEPTDQQSLAGRLDEALEIIARLWDGEAVTYRGTYYRTHELRLPVRPVQRPRVPIWVGGDWKVGGVRRRLVRWDGCCVYRGAPGTPAHRPLLAGEVRELLAGVRRERGTSDGFEVCVGGRERDPDWQREREYLASLADAGATWWQEWVQPGDIARARAAVTRGPLRTA